MVTELSTADLAENGAVALEMDIAVVFKTLATLVATLGATAHTHPFLYKQGKCPPSNTFRFFPTAS